MLFRFLWLPIIPLAISGCISTGTAAPSKSSLGYELEAKTEFKIGIREYAVTDYTYWQVDGSKRTKLWTKQYQQAYAYHWISPAGRVWIITSGLPGPGAGGAGLYVADKAGDIKGTWGYSAGMKGSGNPYDTAKSTVVELRPGVEQLRLVHKDGRETRVTQVEDSAGVEQYSFSQNLPSASTKPEGTLELVLADTSYQIPELGETLADWSYRDFRAIKVGETKPHKTWRQFYQQQRGRENRMSMLLTKEMPVSQSTFSTRSYAMRILNFHLEGPRPTLEILKGDGSVILKKIDLAAEGKMTAAEAIATWDPDKVRYMGGGWHPLKKMERRGAGGPDRLDAFDSSGRRHMIDIAVNDKVTYTILQGLAIREPKETGYSFASIVSQRVYESPSSKFKLRIRRRDGKDFGTAWNATMLYSTTNNGEEYNVELWSDLWIGRFNGQARVFDNGIAMYFNEAGDSLKLVGPSGQAMGGLGPERRGAAGHPIHLKDISIKNTMPPQKTVVDGIEMDLPMTFDIEWKLPNKTLIYHATGGGGTYRMWWSDR